MAPRRRRRGAAPPLRVIPGRPTMSTLIEDMPVTHLHCRDYGHAWRPWRAYWDTDAEAYVQALRCSRCRTARYRHITQTGQLLSSHYDYPEHYLLAPGIGRLSSDERAELRLASVLAEIEAEEAKHA